MNMMLTLRIVLLRPPADVDFALQQGSGTQYESIQIQRSLSNDLYFTLTIEIKGDRNKEGLPGFKSPFVQGKPGANFIYIGVGEFAGQVGGWSRRIKVPLTGIDWDILSQLSVEKNSLLETRFPGTSADGSPACATPKNFGGWKIRKHATDDEGNSVNPS
jgi:hypothetical protein